MQIVEYFRIIGIGLSLKRGSFFSDTTENYEFAAAKNEGVEYPLFGSSSIVLFQVYPRGYAFFEQNIRNIENEYS